MSRRIYKVNRHVPPGTGNRRARNRNAALALLYHPVSDSVAIVYVPETVRAPCIKENTFGGRCLARINVGHDPDISHIL